MRRYKAKVTHNDCAALISKTSDAYLHIFHALVCWPAFQSVLDMASEFKAARPPRGGSDVVANYILPR
ncbi:hypothetical protein ACHAWF_001571 [Thalassiosira exigua]